MHIHIQGVYPPLPSPCLSSPFSLLPLGWKSHGVEIPCEIPWGGNPVGRKSDGKSHGVEIPWGGNPMGFRAHGEEIQPKSRKIH